MIKLYYNIFKTNPAEILYKYRQSPVYMHVYNLYIYPIIHHTCPRLQIIIKSKYARQKKWLYKKKQYLIYLINVILT